MKGRGVAVDVAAFTIDGGALRVLLEERPAQGGWQLPGSAVAAAESPGDAARRILEARFGPRAPYHEQLYTFGEPGRGPISVAYFAVVPRGRAPQGLSWKPVQVPLAFDHGEILAEAVERLHTKTEYSTLPLRFLEEPFTLSEVQAVYEVLLERPLDKRNFRRKMLALEALRQVQGRRRSGAHRPARLFRLSPDRPYLLKERGILFPF